MSSGQEVGAAVSVYRDGRKVVDLWGGYRDGFTRAPWEQDTIVNVFSTTKGVASLTVALAVSRGLIDYDAKVADYWPEFAQAGKGDITVRQLLGTRPGCVRSSRHSRLPISPTRRPVEKDRGASPLGARHQAWLPRDHSRLV